MTASRMKSFVPAVLIFGALALAPTVARAGDDPVIDLFNGLVNVNVSIDEIDNLVYINDVNILDCNYVNVSDLFNDDQINILSVLVQDDPIASFNQIILDDVLQYAQILDGTQLVLGILSDQDVQTVYYIAND